MQKDGVQVRTEVKEFFITFGVQYKAEPDPNYPEEAHPLGMHGNGYAVIEAPDSEIARHIAFAVFGNQWAFFYDEAPEERFAPAGELLRLGWKWSV